MTSMTQPTFIAQTQSPPTTAQPTRAPRTTRTSGFATGAPAFLLRFEGAILLVVATWIYTMLGESWGLFGALFLVPDLAFVAYLGGARVGAFAYNATHSFVGPAMLGVLYAIQPSAVVASVALIWVGHIGFDRMLGYGLKYGTSFYDTHLGIAGRSSRRPANR
jgi:hypothetical protein